MARSRKKSTSAGSDDSVEARIDDAEIVGDTKEEPELSDEGSGVEEPLILEATILDTRLEDDEAETGAGQGSDKPVSTEPDSQQTDSADPEMAQADDGSPASEASSRREHAAAKPPAPPAPMPASSTVIPMVIGGAIAALVGFLIARYAGEVAPDPGLMTPQEIAAALDAQGAQVDSLETQLSELLSADPVAPVRSELAQLTDRVAALGQDLDGLAGRLSDVAERVETIAMRPVPASVDPEAFDAELAKFRSELAAAIASAQAEIAQAREEAGRISEAAFAAEQAAAIRAAWSSVRSAIDGGGAFAEPLDELSSLSDIAIPSPIAAVAASGAPTLAALQEDFPDAARRAIQASIRADIDGSAVDRMMAFLRVQTGARSLEPREGDDPDAVLSRAEAVLKQGDVVGTLELVAQLPQPGQEAMAAWVELAETRLAVLSAAEELDAQLVTE